MRLLYSYIIYLFILIAINIVFYIIHHTNTAIFKRIFPNFTTKSITIAHTKKVNKKNIKYLIWPFLISLMATYIYYCVLLFQKALLRGIWDILYSLSGLLMRAIELAPPPHFITIAVLLLPFSKLEILADNYYGGILAVIILIAWLLLCFWWFKQSKFLSGAILFIYMSIMLSPMVSLVSWLL